MKSIDTPKLQHAISQQIIKDVVRYKVTRITFYLSSAAVSMKERRNVAALEILRQKIV
jgi:hypothetical protein